jgi:hypothetical protein
MSNNTSWLTQTVTRSRSVAPSYGFGMGDVCPQAVGVIAGTPMRKRHADALWATPGSARPPWSPPVT